MKSTAVFAMNIGSVVDRKSWGKMQGMALWFLWILFGNWRCIYRSNDTPSECLSLTAYFLVALFKAIWGSNHHDIAFLQAIDRTKTHALMLLIDEINDYEKQMNILPHFRLV